MNYICTGYFIEFLPKQSALYCKVVIDEIQCMKYIWMYIVSSCMYILPDLVQWASIVNGFLHVFLTLRLMPLEVELMLMCLTIPQDVCRCDRNETYEIQDYDA